MPGLQPSLEEPFGLESGRQDYLVGGEDEDSISRGEVIKIWLALAHGEPRPGGARARQARRFDGNPI